MPEGEAAAKPELKVVSENDASVPVADAASPTDENVTANPAQGEMPFAVVQGEAITELPQDLYIRNRTV